MRSTLTHMLSAVGVAAILLAPLPLALPAAADGSAESAAAIPADPFVPPVDKVLTPSKIHLTTGSQDGRLRLVAENQPLALIAVATDGDGRVRVTSRGTDFTQPSLWRQQGFGDMCWRQTGFDGQETYTLPPAAVPFAAPRADWEYGNVIVGTAHGPVVFNRPLVGEYVSGMGSPIESVIVCLDASTQARSLRADPAPTPDASVPTDAAAKSDHGDDCERDSECCDRDSDCCDRDSDCSANDRKVTICHATSSNTNPYNQITVSVNSIAHSGHLGHTGPLYPQLGWGDVIPPIQGVTGGVNWPAGSGLLADQCVVQPVDPIDPVDPIHPIDPPELPVKPKPPIIEVEPPVQPSPTATPSTPVGSATPIATPSTPVGSATPIATPSTPVGSATPEPSATVATPDASTPAATPPATSSPEVTTTPVSEAAPGLPGEPGSIVEDLRHYCATRDTKALDAEPGLQRQKVDVVLTNGVSTVDLTRPFTTMYCVAQAGTITDKPAGADNTSATDAALVDTGLDIRGTLAASLLLVGIGLLLIPAIARRR